MDELLLDSHALLWSVYEPEKLSTRATDLIANPANKLFVSIASLWEIANKAAFYRLPLVGQTIDLLLFHCEQLQIEFLPVTVADVLASGKLLPHHADPFDRILIVQAQRRSLLLITNDADIKRYEVTQAW